MSVPVYFRGRIVGEANLQIPKDGQGGGMFLDARISDAEAFAFVQSDIQRGFSIGYRPGPLGKAELTISEQPPEAGRRTGQTSHQIRSAPDRAIFIWCNSETVRYARELARHLGRLDIRVVSIDALTLGQELQGVDCARLVLDHAARLNGRQREYWLRLHDRCGGEHIR